jgi:hypothetical protein
VCVQIIKAKLAGRAPLEAAELIPLEQAVAEAKSNGLRDDSPALRAGLELKSRLESILVLQEEMKSALESKDSKLQDFRKLLEKADKLDVSKDVRSLANIAPHAFVCVCVCVCVCAATVFSQSLHVFCVIFAKCSRQWFRRRVACAFVREVARVHCVSNVSM